MLGLLSVTHLLEYQSTTTPSTTNNNNNNTGNSSGSRILRGAHLDVLVVLATTGNPAASNGSSSNTNNSSSGIGHCHNAAMAACKFSSALPSQLLFQEAFLATYRTMCKCSELVDKLIVRYRLLVEALQNGGLPAAAAAAASGSTTTTTTTLDEKFDLERLRASEKQTRAASVAARNTLTFLVRVVDELSGDGVELDQAMVDKLCAFARHLIAAHGELQFARLIRKHLVNKLQQHSTLSLNGAAAHLGLVVLNSTTINAGQHANVGANGGAPGCNQLHASISSASLLSSTSFLSTTSSTITKISRNRIGIGLNGFGKSVLDFRSIDLARQMTLIDQELFLRVNVAELLMWSTRQNENTSPNLTRFTEHFNKISYWARSRILESSSERMREKIMTKLLKTMKHLRHMNNFNSYLSLLSAVDSGPVQRLDWPRHIAATIEAYSSLIDPRCGFKLLREAVAEASVPCIPHIGLILQDLTILHIANPDYLVSGNCNFWKRWQQFNMLERFRYFRRW